MARAGSTTSRSTARKSAAVKAAEAAADGMVETVGTDAPAEITAENDFDSTLVEAETPASTTEVEETDTVSTETVEAPEASDTTEATTAPTETTEEAAAKAAAEAEANGKYDEYTAAVKNALAEHDPSTGSLPEVHLSAVKVAYQALAGAKFKKKAKDHLVAELQSAVNSADIFRGMAVMNLSNLVNSTASAPKPPAERKPVDPAAKFIDELAVLNLAYLLRRNDVPEGVTTDGDEGAFAKAEAKVADLVESAEAYVAWVKSTAEDKGDEPQVDAIVKRAVKASTFKSAGSAKSSTPSAPRVSTGGPRRNVRTHVTQVFADKEAGTVLKVAEIANAKTEEYPDGDCSPGAVSAALKSPKGIEGFEKTNDANGNLAARKL